ncbi:Glycosyltransferase involved in cell wall bisynthesis [Halpernia humi]|uniref:Glycosyltransferase involved in cell wall bisynthesis n=1 Tax=Halpernia humi TaxID=493375 RepID=A0A1H6AN21_9FLAO|nr:glycosyltransferase family 4 protein [Halpernia humi]SEG50119.1 Glycosyltransferase involved in cell wall bisynthesis [Halpernia humi]
MKKFKVGYYCLHNPENKKAWSGTHYSMMKAIEDADCEVVNLSPILYPRSYHRLLAVYNKIHKLFSDKLIYEEFTFLSAIYSAIYFKKIIKNKEIDILFCPAASAQFVFLPSRFPVIFFNDSTFDQLKNYYTNFKYFSNYSLNISSLLQKLALKKASKIILSSNWAKDFVVKHYKNLEHKIVLSSLGANMEIPNSIHQKKYNSPFVFLFVGLNWERKGGDLVLETVENLQKRGFKIILNCVGVKPPVEKEYMVYHGFLDKTIAKDALLLNRLYSESHFLFVPSRAECYGIVFSEASAYGLVSIASNTGGIPSVVNEGVNGFLFSLDAPAEDYAKKIENILLSPNLLKELSLRAREFYENNLDWHIFSEKFNQICQDIMFKSKS